MCKNNEIIEMLSELCDVISDMPCGCDCCPYKETMDDNTGDCNVTNMIQFLKNI